ncbi:hypothetical protein TRAPUB_11937 [Trametes pubescens]|uniref:Uncharacterized protein n=1 Tax=Trametes pubescens TaxID=154538 RepID=A0A1M2VV78_TRAPU|nr:hypothetical protein TRAPUB_11937 [Trametes pubescens]
MARAPISPLALSQRQLSTHSCHPCDADFTVLRTLQQHRSELAGHDARREAVQYGSER